MALQPCIEWCVSWSDIYVSIYYIYICIYIFIYMYICICNIWWNWYMDLDLHFGDNHHIIMFSGKSKKTMESSHVHVICVRFQKKTMWVWAIYLLLLRQYKVNFFVFNFDVIRFLESGMIHSVTQKYFQVWQSRYRKKS